MKQRERQILKTVINDTYRYLSHSEAALKKINEEERRRTRINLTIAGLVFIGGLAVAVFVYYFLKD